MALNDVIIVQTSGGLGRKVAPADGVCGLLFNGVAVVGGLQLNTAYRLTSIDDLAALLIDAAYDTTNSVLVFETINDFFRLNPTGELWIYGIDNTLTYAQMVTQKTEALVNGSAGAVKVVGYSYNTALTGIPASPVDLSAVVAAAEVIADTLTASHYPISTAVEMATFDIADATDWHSKNARRVSAVIAQNYAIAQNATHAKRCAIGVFLGTISLASVHENIGWVQKFNALGGDLSKASIGGTEISQLTNAQLTTFNDHGLIFLRNLVGILGLYFNDSFTCTVLTDDFAYIESNRSIDKATRLIRSAFLPYLNSPIYVDPSTGKLAPNVVASLEAVGSKTITDQMLSEGELSGFTFTIDPEQDILSTSNLEAVLQITPVGTARKITVKIGFNNPFN